MLYNSKTHFVSARSHTSDALCIAKNIFIYNKYKTFSYSSVSLATNHANSFSSFSFSPRVHSNGFIVTVFFDKAELFSQTVASTSNLHDSGSISPTPLL